MTHMGPYGISIKFQPIIGDLFAMNPPCIATVLFTLPLKANIDYRVIFTMKSLPMLWILILLPGTYIHHFENLIRISIFEFM